MLGSMLGDLEEEAKSAKNGFVINSFSGTTTCTTEGTPNCSCHRFVQTGSWTWMDVIRTQQKVVDYTKTPLKCSIYGNPQSPDQKLNNQEAEIALGGLGLE